MQREEIVDLELTVVVMAYNEAETVDSTCREILDVISTLGIPSEVIVVDDGSTDGTGDRADLLATADARIRVVHHSPNQGLGAVYRTGFSEARGRYVTFFPADGQFPSQIINDFLPRMTDNDVVLGYLPSGTRSIFAESLSSIERLLYRMLLGRIPRFQGILMFRRELLHMHALQSTGRGWAILMEFVVRCARGNHPMVSVATAVRPRTHGVSKVNNLRTIRSNLLQLLELRRILTSLR